MNNATSAAILAGQAQDAVQHDRLQAAIAALAQFGLREDGGVSRQTLTAVDLDSRRYLIAQAQAIGCRVTIDDCGNLFFRRAGLRDDLPPVLTGSHADTQPVGGKLDGAYGVVAGLEVLSALNDAGIQTLRPIEVVSWTNEEGSRFGPGTMGSSAFADPSRLASYRESRDRDGVRMGDELDKALAQCADIPRSAMSRPLHACIELHIEQGPVLERQAVPLGVVTGIQAVRWFTVTCKGQMAHAGTTPMDTRQDAMALAVPIAQQLYAYAAAHFDTQLRLTLGRWSVVPNSVNTIPSEVTFSVDMRCLDDAVLDGFEAFLREQVAQGGARIEMERFFQRAPTAFPPAIVNLVHQATARASAQAQLPAPIELTSGAFHDAMYVADLCPTGMIFVPSIRGISHNAAEATDPRDLYLGVQALAYAVTQLANDGC